jgi:hypothetical protein
MLRKTQTTLAALRIGDSFVYPKGNVAWRVTARADRKGKVAVNQFRGKEPINKYDTLKKKDTKVTFLQHTAPVPGELIFLENLEVGDIFKRKDDSVHEYVIEKKGHDFYDCRRLDQPTPIKGGRISEVIFIRHKGQEAK